MNLDHKISNEAITIDGETYTFNDLTGIGPDLNREFSVQANRYAYIAALTANAEVLYNEAKHNRDTVYSSLELDYREKLIDEGVKATEATIKSFVQTDNRYNEAVVKEHKALGDWKLLRAMEAGLRERGQMLISLGANLRQEYDMTGMQINQTKERLKELKG